MSLLSEIKMAALRSYEEQLLFLAKDKGDLENKELLGFYLYLTELPPPIPHQNYLQFELNKYTDEECLLNFRFQKVDVLHLVTAITQPIFMQKWYNR